jgi:hypothetical protein
MHRLAAITTSMRLAQAQPQAMHLVITKAKDQMLPRRSGWNMCCTKAKSNTNRKHAHFDLLHFKNRVSHPK